MKITFVSEEEKDWFIGLLDFARDAGFTATSDYDRAEKIVGPEGNGLEGFAYDNAVRAVMNRIQEEHHQRMWSFLLAFRAACKNAGHCVSEGVENSEAMHVTLHKDVPFVEGDKSFCCDGVSGMGLMVSIPKDRPWAADWSINT